MEALVAVGVASNVVQFVDFATKLVQTANELRHHTASSENRDHAIVVTHLEALASNIRDRKQAIAQSSTMASVEEKALQPVAEGCCSLARQLLKRLEVCGIQTTQNVGVIKRTRKAIKCTWSKREIQEIVGRLDHFRNEIQLHLTHQIQQNQVTDRTLDPIRENSISTLQKVNELKADIAGLQSESTQLHAETVQRITSSTTSMDMLILRELETLKSDLQATSNTVRQNSERLDSIAEVSFQNGHLFAHATQMIPSLESMGPSFHDALRVMLAECQPAILNTVRKEFRGTFRSELTNMNTEIHRALDEIQSRIDKNQGEPENIPNTRGTPSPIGEYNNSDACRITYDLKNSLQKPYHHQKPQTETNVELIQSSYWCLEKRIGKFALRICHKAMFDTFGHTTTIFELTAQFIPSPLWISKGCTVTFQNISDSRGSPVFTFRPRTYRVLESKHEAFGAIYEGHTKRIQEMLSQKMVSPFDCDTAGTSLLHHAVRASNLDICKALIACGADINSFDGDGSSVFANAIEPHNLLPKRNSQNDGKAIVLYLRGLTGIDLSNILLERDCSEHYALHFAFLPIYEGLENVFHEWELLIKSADLDFDPSRFVLKLIATLAIQSETEESSDINTPNARPRLIDIFDTIVFKIAGDTESMRTNIPIVAYATVWLMHFLYMGTYESLVLGKPSELCSHYYRGYYVSLELIAQMLFLEHVISMGIDFRPDSIFDTYDALTVYDRFLSRGWADIWVKILEEHGIDPNWALHEDERRKRVILGETSAHDIDKPVQNVTDILQVKRRRTFEANQD